MKNSSSSSTQRKCAFARKCARLVKEQRARFYIMRRYSSELNALQMPSNFELMSKYTSIHLSSQSLRGSSRVVIRTHRLIDANDQ
ncbi:hypothetical protein JHK85_043897 [Glycine max]|nr:hypothetical protein JHK85_043897 [Glycine max]